MDSNHLKSFHWRHLIYFPVYFKVPCMLLNGMEIDTGDKGKIDTAFLLKGFLSSNFQGNSVFMLSHSNQWLQLIINELKTKMLNLLIR